MKEFKGTKGDWNVRALENGWYRIANSPVDVNEESRCNRKLIAAAPDLLKTIQELVYRFKPYATSFKDDIAINEAQSAINKALD